jgi:pimeloyl-ACP methyl ester carboxylesterase
MPSVPTPREREFLAEGPTEAHRIVYWEWGATNRTTLIAMHGLTRNGRDFDWVAGALSADYRIICPDVAGRGKSSWLKDTSLYGYPTYLADALALIAAAGGEPVDWLGTSMGGIVGVLLAAQPSTLVRRLILNDVGALIPKASLDRIGSYVGQDPHFQSMTDLEAYLRRIHASFGPLSDLDWAHLANHSARTLNGGGYGLAYDPAIGLPFRQKPVEDVDLWQVWDSIRCPVLLLRGGQSDVLPRDTAEEMVRRKPDTELVEFAECGHAPALASSHQIAAVQDWLGGT